MPSPYYDRVQNLLQQIDIAFTNAFQLIQPYQTTDYLAGDRYGILDFQSYGADPNRFALSSVRGGVEAKIFRGSLLLSIALDGKGKDDTLMQREANQCFMAEAIEIEERLAQMHQEFDSHGFAYELELDGTVDKGVSVVLRDRTTWLVNITADVVLRFMVNRAIDGSLRLPLNNVGN